jgi:hypothetical protein
VDVTFKEKLFTYPSVEEDSSDTSEPDTDGKNAGPPAETGDPSRSVNEPPHDELGSNAEVDNPDQAHSEPAEEPPRYRSRDHPTRITRAPIRLIEDYVMVSREEALFGTPKSYKDAIAGPHKAEWKEAMEREMKNLEDKNTWKLVPMPSDRPIIMSMWTYKVKLLSNGSIDKFKARLVGRGDQQSSETFEDIFSPTPRIATVRLAIALSSTLKLKGRQIDFVGAYLNANVQQEIYMHLPPGYLQYDKNHTKLVALLVKSIYGLKQAGYEWHGMLCGILLDYGVTQSHHDPCLFFKEDMIIVCYVDDCLIYTRTDAQADHLITHITRSCPIEDRGIPSWFLAIKIEPSSDAVFLSQESYVSQLLTLYNMTECNPAETPMTAGLQLASNHRSAQHQEYRSLVGALMYLANCTRPDICYAVNYLGRFVDAADQTHFSAAKRVLAYLKGTPAHGLAFHSRELNVHAYVDADWGSDDGDRKSVSGASIFINSDSSPVTWLSTKQRCVALSTCASEYIALTEAAKEVLQITGIISEITNTTSIPLLLSDNKSAIALAERPSYKRAKHIDIRYCFLRDLVMTNQIRIQHVPGESNVADLLTKATVKAVFVKHRPSLCRPSLRGRVKGQSTSTGDESAQLKIKAAIEVA